MAWRPHGHARVSPASPRAAAICDYCGFLFNLNDLRWAYQWAGPRLQNLRYLVCQKCWDVPQPQLKPRILPPDPVPVLNARPADFLYADYDYRATEDGSIRITQDDDRRIVENIANNRTPPDE